MAFPGTIYPGNSYPSAYVEPYEPPSDPSVKHLKSRVLVNGVQRDVISWSIDREISGGLPAQVIAGGGITQATGSIDWGQTSDVEESGANPWRRGASWMPAKGSRVEIFVEENGTERKQFHGVIDSTTGSIGGGMQSKIIDDYDKLSTTVTYGPLLSVMPPRVSGGNYRGTGLVSSFYVDMAMRQAGFYLTPKQESECVLHIPCQGGMWPHVGTSHRAQRLSGSGAYPSNKYRLGGFSVSNFDMIYIPSAQRTVSTSVQLTMMVGTGHSGFAYMKANYGGGKSVRLAVNAARWVSAQVDDAPAVSFTVPENTVVTLRVSGNVATLRASTGQSASRAVSFTGGGVMENVVIQGDDDVRISGIQVSHPPSSLAFQSIGFKPTAHLNTSDVSFMGVLRAGRALDGEAAVSLLDEISSATLASMWIDELGVLQWWPALALKGRGSSATVTTRDDILSLSWEDSLLGSRSRVIVRYKEPALKISKYPNVELWAGSGGVLGSGETIEEFIGPSADQAWIMPDGNPTVLRLPDEWWKYNRLRGAMAGGYYTKDSDMYSHTNLSLSVVMEAISVTRFKITQTAGTYPADVVVNLETPATEGLWVQNRGKSLPRIPGFAFAEWAERESAQPTAVGIGPELVHETGIWAPADLIPRYTDYLSGETAVPKPTISGMEVVYDPRRKLGEVITISSPSLMGVEMTALVVGISNSADSDGFTQSLTVRIISATSTSLTYGEFNTLASGAKLTYAQWQALGPIPETYQQFNSAG